MDTFGFQICLMLLIGRASADLSCHRWDSVCVCNSTYCDTITREAPNEGQFVTYTSSEGGSRFKKNYGYIEIVEQEQGVDGSYNMLLCLQPNKVYQSIEGFGGAVTDSAAINWNRLSPEAQQHMIQSYFGANGLEYNMIRVPIGSTDFSTRPWTYNSIPVNDTKFSNFTLSYEDINYKVPLIAEIFKTAVDYVKVVAATWSPPDWMLDVNQPSGISSIKKEYYQAFADYQCKFAELYKQNGINIWALSPVNEPLISIMASVKNESIGWTGPSLAKFWVKNFGPTMRNCSAQGIKILGVEDQRFTVPLWFNQLKQSNDSITDYIDGVSLHFYSDNYTSPAVITRSLKDYPEKFAIATEACNPIKKSELGPWSKAIKYAKDILEDLNYNFVGWIDWNLFLDENGGPSWLSNFVDSPVIVNAKKNEFYKQPMFYVMGHFSKFIPRESQRIKITKVTQSDDQLDFQDIESKGQDYFDNVAFLTPRGTIVVVVNNEGPQRKIAVQLDNQQITLSLEADSITTLEFPYTCV